MATRFLASFSPTASFFPLLFFVFYSASGNSVPLALACFFKKSIGISQNRGGGGVVFTADYSAPYQLFIYLLVDFNPRKQGSLICLIRRHRMVNIQREKCKVCCGEAQQNRNKLPIVSHGGKLVFC